MRYQPTDQPTNRHSDFTSDLENDLNDLENDLNDLLNVKNGQIIGLKATKTNALPTDRPTDRPTDGQT